MIVIMLISVVSLEFQFPACIAIHNQCSNIELVSPVYFGNEVVCPKLSDQQMNISAKMRTCFEINAARDDFEGALLFKLQRYVGSNAQHNTDTLTIKTNKNETKCVQMFVAWKIISSEPFVHVVLVEHTKEFTWNEDALKKLYYGNHHQFWGYDDVISDTWFIDDNMALRTAFGVRDLKGNFELNISISEGERDTYAIKPLCAVLRR
jgi:hypothetical protein